MREYLLVLLTAASATYLLAGLCRRIAVRTGALAKVRERDVHAAPTPYLGGVAMFGGVLVAFVLASQLPFLGMHPTVTQDAQGILAAAFVICVVGALDDMIDLPVVAKVAGQMLAAGVAVLNGVRLYWISLPDRIVALDPATSILLTLVFIFIAVNAINLVDGLDGLASGVVAIGALALFSYTYLLAFEERLVLATTASLVAVTIAGVCLGFLPHNFFPARMFMGDSGSMLLGLLLACSSLSFTGQIDSSAINANGAGGVLPALLPILLPFAIMFVPLLDLVLAYVRRTMRGNWWFKPDKQHLHHRLLERGHSQVKAVALMYLWTAVVAFGVIIVGLVNQLVVTLVVGVAIVTVFVVTLYPLRRSPSLVSGADKPV